MKESRLTLEESQKVDFVKGLRGKVFHVTLYKNLESIKRSSGILVNTDCKLETAFGNAANSLYRINNCVSVFDYESPSSEKWQDHMWKCSPLLKSDEEDLAFLFLSEEAKNKLIRWVDIKGEWTSERVVPYVEAGYPGTLLLSNIVEILIVNVLVDKNSLAYKLKQAQNNANKVKIK
ncbi:MAG: hypothetical protein JAZ06_14405 [Candidatus Thiodiazotropha taylori]|nr:hypothetical protein [Candidatus Thiodiazotropha taylori]